MTRHSQRRSIICLLAILALTTACRLLRPSELGAVTEADLIFCVEETNRRRAQAGAPPVERSTSVEAFAQRAAAHAAETGRAHGYFIEHPPPTGWGQNQVIRWPASSGMRPFIRAAITTFWDEQPNGGHYQNLIGPYRFAGCGIHVSGSKATLSQDFQQ